MDRLVGVRKKELSLEKVVRSDERLTVFVVLFC